MMKLLLKTQLQCQLVGSNRGRSGAGFSKRQYVLNQHLLYGTVSLIARIYKSRNQGVEGHRKIFASCYSDFKYCWPRSLGSRVGSAPTSSHSKHFIEPKAQMFPWPLWASDAFKPID